MSSPNTGNLGCFCPFHGPGFGGGDDGDVRVRWAVWRIVVGSFERPVSHFPFDDTGVGAAPAGGEQSGEDLSDCGFDGAGESAGGKTPPGR